MVHIAEEVQPCDYRTVHHAVICHGASLSDNDGLEAAEQAISRYTKAKKYIFYSKKYMNKMIFIYFILKIRPVVKSLSKNSS